MLNKAIEAEEKERVDNIKAFCNDTGFELPPTLENGMHQYLKQEIPLKNILTENIRVEIKWALGIAFNREQQQNGWCYCGQNINQ